MTAILSREDELIYVEELARSKNGKRQRVVQGPDMALGGLGNINSKLGDYNLRSPG